MKIYSLCMWPISDFPGKISCGAFSSYWAIFHLIDSILYYKPPSQTSSLPIPGNIPQKSKMHGMRVDVSAIILESAGEKSIPVASGKFSVFEGVVWGKGYLGIWREGPSTRESSPTYNRWDSRQWIENCSVLWVNVQPSGYQISPVSCLLLTQFRGASQEITFLEWNSILICRIIMKISIFWSLMVWNYNGVGIFLKSSKYSGQNGIIQNHLG